MLDHTPFYAESGGQIGDAGMLVSERGGALHGARHAQNRRVVRACRRARQRRVARRRCGRSTSRSASAAPPSRSIIRPRICCTRRCARCSASTWSKKARWSRPIACASIFRTPRRCNAGGITAGRGTRQCRHPPQRAGGNPRHGAGRCGRRGRDVAVRREIRERRASIVDRRFFDGTLRRHARRTSGRHRFVQDPERVGSCGWSAARRGGHRTRRRTSGWCIPKQVLRDIAAMLRGSRDDVDEKVRELVERSRRLEKEVQQLKSKLASGQGGDLSSQAKDVGGIKVLAAQIDGCGREVAARCGRPAEEQVGLFGDRAWRRVQEGKVVLVAGVSADLLTRMKAGDIAGAVAAQIGGKGGGRADFAQAGGTQPENLGKALAGVETADPQTDWLIERFVYSDGKLCQLPLVFADSCDCALPASFRCRRYRAAQQSSSLQCQGS